MTSRVRTGVALLLVLVMLPALTIGAVAALSTARSASTVSDRATGLEQARLLVNTLDPLLVEWLNENADLIPLNDDGQPPIDPAGLRLVYDGGPLAQTAEDDAPLSLRVEALDLSGRLHVSHAASFARLRLPTTLMRAVESLPAEQPDPQPEGTPPATLDEVIHRAHIPDTEAPALVFPSTDPAAAQEAACLWLTTLGSRALNLHSAPVPLLEAALQGADASLSVQALAARRAGEPIPAGIARQLIRDRASQIERLGSAGSLVPLTDRSDAYAFLITVQQGASTHRWWLSYEHRQVDGEWTWLRIERRLIGP